MAESHKRKRLEAAIAGEPVDRLPVALWRHWPVDDQDAAELAASHVQWQTDYDWDFLKVSPASSFCLVDWGVEDRWEGHAEGTRSYTRHVVHRPEDWARLPVLDPRRGMLGTQIEALALLADHFGDEVPIIATIFSPLAQAKNLAGKERALSLMRSHPDAFRQGLERITESTLRYVEAARRTGISGIFYAIQHARYGLLSPSEYSLFGQPFDEQILAAASDFWLNVIHVHGDDTVFFDTIADYDVPVINWHDRDCGTSLKEGLAQVGGAACGGVSRNTVQLGSPADVVAEASSAVAQTGGRRLILGTGCVVMTNSPLGNIRALRRFADGDRGSGIRDQQ
ncbi:MAG: uroporphyrinogen decarboxylase family protein [Anaerolineae bacterium]|nr:uroporphyrinogen decarboxylase family protein [Anaerolineae bacterium]